MKQLRTEKILDYAVVSDPLDKCLEVICEWLEGEGRARVFVCANPHSLVLAEKDPGFKAAIRTADLVTPDGSGIVLASRMLGGNIRQRVTGSDVFLGLSRKLNERGGRRYRYFFLGSTEANLSAIENRMAVDYPGVEIAGSYSPPFKVTFSEDDNRKMITAINRVAPDVLWVGMTAPKQEKWIYRHRNGLNVKFIGAIGAAFDFYTGNVKRSHPVFQRMGLEWLPRLVRDPRRLYDRTLVSAPKFLGMVLRDRGLRAR